MVSLDPVCVMLCVRVNKCVMSTGLCYVVCPCRQVCDEYWFVLCCVSVSTSV